MASWFGVCSNSKVCGKAVEEIDNVAPEPIFVEAPPVAPPSVPTHQRKTPAPSSARSKLNQPVPQANAPKVFKPLTRIPTSACLEEKAEDAPPQFDKFEITLVKGEGDIVGIDADWGDMTFLRIVNIKAGLIVKWNNSNPSQKVDVGDAIVEVNGAKGDSRTLLEKLKDNTNLSLTIQKGDGSKDGSKDGEGRKVDHNRRGIELLVDSAAGGVVSNTKFMFYMNWSGKK